LANQAKKLQGLLMEDETRLAVSTFVQDYDEAFFGDDGLSLLRQWLEENVASTPRVAKSVRLGPPIYRPSKIVCIGLKFRDHAREKQSGDSGRAGHIFQIMTSLVGPNSSCRRMREK